MRRTTLLIVGAVVLIVIGLAAWRFLAPLEVAVLKPQPHTEVTLFGLGNTDAERVSKAGFDVSGIVVEMAVRVGDRVKAGQTIARLDTRREELRVAAAAAALDLAQATQSQRAAHLGTTTATVALKRLQADRAQTLATRGSGPLSTAQDAAADLTVAIADNAESNSALGVAEASIKQSQAALAQEREELDHHILKAPFDAVVTDRLAVEGAVVQAGQPVVSLAGLASLRVLGFINEAQSGELAPGQPVAIVLRSRPGETFNGHLDRVEPASDQVTEERSVSVVFDKLPEPFYLAEQAEVRVAVASLDNVLLVPERAVRDRAGRTGTIWVVENGRLAERRVDFGHRMEDGRMSIAAPLPDGVRAVADRLASSHVGEGVRVTEAPPP